MKIFETGDMDGYFFVAMEYVEGHDLSDLLRGGPARPDDAADIALSICRTLHNAHSLDVVIDGKAFHGIVHGDIKPKNIRLDVENRVRVLDFGIAKALSLSRKLTRNDFGSVAYAVSRAPGFGRRGFHVRSLVAGRDALRTGHRDRSPTRPRTRSAWSA